MNNKERLQKLKQLQIIRREGALFKSSDECMSWIDNVAPLLKYDETHYNDFLGHADVVRITNLSANTLMPHLNSMLGIVNQTIIELENKIESIQPQPISIKTISNIKDLTIKDLIFASNYRILLLLISIFLSGLLIGTTLGSSKLYKEKIIPLIELYKTQDTIPKTQNIPITPEQKNTAIQKLINKSCNTTIISTRLAIALSVFQSLVAPAG